MSYAYNHVTLSQSYAWQEIEQFLSKNGLSLDPGVTDFMEARHNGNIVACAGVDHNIIKCVAIQRCYRGGGVSLRLMSELFNLLNSRNLDELYLFTKPENRELFTASGFHPIAQHDDQVVLMENSATRLQNYCQKLSSMAHAGAKIGSIVLNANPFTLGHLHLVTTSANACDWLHVFLVREDASLFKYDERFSLVQQGIAEIPNVTLHQGSDYLISRVSFPNYFLKDKAAIDSSHAALDLKLFREKIAPALHITHRFVGSEPMDRVTNAYNQEMRFYLQEETSSAPAIEVVEIERILFEGKPISASRVREALVKGDWDLLQQLLPPTTYAFLQKEQERLIQAYHQRTHQLETK
ncbi:MAG: [citrate (pro-3S)-lyase] ligase [Saezia sp.]